MATSDEIAQFVADWKTDSLALKPAFMKYYGFLTQNPDLSLDFKGRPQVSYSIRAKHARQQKRDLFTLIDVIDDEPESRWLSVCFYADLVQDPQELGDFVPEGLLGEDALCFNLDENNPEMEEYIFERLREAAANAAK
ncbi:MAG: hypothetical protein HDQ91_06700 [Desulfovibrio sp.]|nr:hypothetical protein [Desulfovibrio sp.]